MKSKIMTAYVEFYKYIKQIHKVTAKTNTIFNIFFLLIPTYINKLQHLLIFKNYNYIKIKIFNECYNSIMKLCFFVNNYTFTGGLERVFSIVTNGLSSKVPLDIVSMYSIPSESPYHHANNINIHVIHHKQNKSYINDSFKTIKTLKKIVKDNKYDYLIYVSELLSPFAYSACKNTNTKCVCWMHTPAFAYDNPIIQRALRYYSMKKANYTITLTQKSKDKLISKYNTSKVSFIPNPIDPELLKYNTAYDSNSKKIISVGRICFAKNYEKLIEVAKQTLPELPGWTWDIYGDGDQKILNTLKSLIQEYKLDNKVFLKGNSNNIYDEYQNYSMLVMTSRYEGFPMTLLEAMSKNLPLIAFDILTGPGEIIKDHVNGLLIEPFNTNQMTNSILYLANNKEERLKMSKETKNFIDLYSLDHITDLWIKTLNSI